MTTETVDVNYMKLGQIYQILEKLDWDNLNHSFEFNSIKSILESGFEINYSLTSASQICKIKPQFLGYTALHFLLENLDEDNNVFYENDPFIKLFIEHGADLNINNNLSLNCTPLQLGFFKEIQSNYLLNQLKKNISSKIHCKNGITNFHLACIKESAAFVKSFFEVGASIDERVNDNSPIYPGYTPLHFAADFENLEIVKLLLNNNANLFSKDTQGQTPFDILCKQGVYPQDYIQEISHLISSSMGITNLHIKCCSDNVDLVDNILNEDTDIDSHIKCDSLIWPGRTPLHIAITCDNLRMAKLLLKKGANLLAKDANGKTPLDLCSQREVDTIIQFLLAEKLHKLSDIKLTDGTHLLNVLRVLQNSNQFEKFVKMKVLNINSYIPLNSPIWPGYNLLHLLVLFFKNECLLQLLSCNVDLTMLNADGMSFLHLAFRLSNSEGVNTILNFYANFFVDCVDRDNVSYLHIASAAKHYEAIEHFLRNGSDPNLATRSDIDNCISYYKIKAGSTALHIAVKQLDFNVIDLLLSFGANPDATNIDGATPCTIFLDSCDSFDYEKEKIADSVHIKILFLFLNKNSKDKLKITRAIGLAIMQDNSLNYDTAPFLKKVMSEFLEEKQYEKRGMNKLHVACAIGDLSMVKEEIESGTDVNQCIALDSKIWPGDTALHILFRKNLWLQHEIAEFLLEHGANPTLKNASNLTPVHLSKNGNLDLGILLLRNKFTCVNPADNNGLSHLHMSCMTNNVLVVKEFIKSGVNVNGTVDYFADNDAGFTSLHFAVKYGYKEIIKLLLSNNADQYTMNAERHTPFHLKISSEQFDLIKDVFRYPIINLQTKNEFGITIFERFFKNYDIDNDNLDEFIMNLILENRICIDFAKFTATSLKMFESKLIISTALFLSKQTFQRLINSIPDLTNTDDKGLSALHHIIDAHYYLKKFCILNKEANNYIENIKILINTVCEVNHKDNQGETALHKALCLKIKEFHKTFKVLLTMGADINIKDDKGKTPYFYLNRSTSNEHIKAKEDARKHIRKLELVGLSVCHSNKISTNYSLDAYEIEKIRREKSYLDIKFKEFNLSISAYYFYSEQFIFNYKRMPKVQRQAICSICNDSYLYNTFPETHDLINLQFRKARSRIRLIEPALTALQSLVGLGLPDLCADMIFDYLNNDDLMNVVRAVNRKLTFAPLPKNY